jgi:hypothetical protein
VAWAPAVRWAALQRAAQLYDDGRQGSQRDAAAPDFGVREAVDAGGVTLGGEPVLTRILSAFRLLVVFAVRSDLLD